MVIPPRCPDWRARLSAYFVAVAARPLVYGTHDCALFVAGAVEAMTGVDPAARWRGRYESILEGLDLLGQDDSLGENADGERDHIHIVKGLFKRVPQAFAQVGDIAVVGVAGQNIPALGIFEGQHIAVLREGGLGMIPRETAILAYRVP